MFTIGVVVEGVTDQTVLRILIRKCRNDAEIIPRKCRGPIFGKFRGILDDFQSRFKIDKALIVSDANGEQPSTLLTRIRRGLAGRSYRFPVEPLVIVQELEAWLLADEEALQNVVGISPRVRKPEDLKDPKRELVRLLSQRNHVYNHALAGRIAEAIRIPILSKTLSAFRKISERDHTLDVVNRRGAAGAGAVAAMRPQKLFRVTPHDYLDRGDKPTRILLDIRRSIAGSLNRKFVVNFDAMGAAIGLAHYEDWHDRRP